MNYIDLEKMLAEGNPGLLKKLPSFALWFLKRIIKQKELNVILNKYEGYEGAAFFSKMLEELNITARIEGLENLPENGKCFFVANHPYGFVDGLILTTTVHKKYGDFRGIGNEVFMMVPHVRPVIAAVNVFGKNPKQYLLELDKLYNSEMPITHFPAGLVSRLKSGKVMDSEWQKSFVTKAISCERDVVPFYFPGRNSNLFYIVYLLRKALGIKKAVELILLAHEIFKKRGKVIDLQIGKPISYTEFDKSKSHYEWAQEVKRRVYALGRSRA